MIEWYKNILGIKKLEDRISELEHNQEELFRVKEHFINDIMFIQRCLNIDYGRLIEEDKWVEFNDLYYLLKSFLKEKYNLNYSYPILSPTRFDYNEVPYLIWNDKYIGKADHICVAELIETVENFKKEATQKEGN